MPDLPKNTTKRALQEALRESMDAPFQGARLANLLAKYGYAVVPLAAVQPGSSEQREPTEAMVEAAAEALWSLYHHTPYGEQDHEQRDVMCEKAEIILAAALAVHTEPALSAVEQKEE